MEIDGGLNMGFYDRSKRIVITRNQAVEKWCVVEPNGQHVPINDVTVEMKAGDVARHVRTKIDPAVQIGVMSDVFGRNCKYVFGEVVWLKI